MGIVIGFCYVDCMKSGDVGAELECGKLCGKLVKNSGGFDDLLDKCVEGEILGRILLGVWECGKLCGICGIGELGNRGAFINSIGCDG